MFLFGGKLVLFFTEKVVLRCFFHKSEMSEKKKSFFHRIWKKRSETKIIDQKNEKSKDVFSKKK